MENYNEEKEEAIYHIYVRIKQYGGYVTCSTSFKFIIITKIMRLKYRQIKPMASKNRRTSSLVRERS